jgi:DNA-binding NarL/FixJ family response regulator
MLLFNEGETDRAYRYITVSLNDVISSGARQRLALVAEYLPIITSAHDLEQQKVAEKRNTIIAVVSVSAVIMALLLLLLYRHNQRLTAMRLQLIESNNKLQQLNGELNMVNSALQESNKIKEVYIAQLFNLCSEHIDKTEHLRLSIMNKLKGGLQKEVVKQLSQSTSNETLRAFFHRFDAIFLQLFPDFIEKFNALLQPGEQLQVKDGALLSPELRIYALVRLGITDSTKIASFLHYSSQTVYNYRQKIRNKANIDKATLVAKIQAL